MCYNTVSVISHNKIVEISNAWKQFSWETNQGSVFYVTYQIFSVVFWHTVENFLHKHCLTLPKKWKEHNRLVC